MDWHNEGVKQRKNQPGYVRVPLPRTQRDGSTGVGHYWVRSDATTLSSSVGPAVRSLVADLDAEDGGDILAQEIIYAFEGEEPSWHDVNSAFNADDLVRLYGDRFVDADIIHIGNKEQNLYCVAAHGVDSLLNAFNKELFSDGDISGFQDADDEDNAWTVGKAASLLWGFSDWTTLRRHGVVPVSTHKGFIEVLPSVSVNADTPIQNGAILYRPGDIVERSRLTENLRESVTNWVENGVVTPELSSFVHEYADASPARKLHRTFFYPNKISWEDAVKSFTPGEGWEMSQDVTDMHETRHQFPTNGEGEGEWVLRFEVFSTPGVPTNVLVKQSGLDTTNVRSGEWLVPGPLTAGVLRVVSSSGDKGGSAVVYLLIP